jgi:large subunit ribosomal protein L3
VAIVTKAILGTKVGMTQVFDETGRIIPVTVIEAGPCFVVQKKTQENDGYNAVQLGFETLAEKKLNKPKQGHFTKAELKPLRYLKECQVEDPTLYEQGQEIKVDLFSAGEWVDVTGVSKGKGFAGVIKRHGMHRGPMKHGSHYHRGAGSLGAKGVARVFRGRRLPGRHGGKCITVQKLLVVKVDPERNLILVKGAVPGPKKSLVTIKSSVKA